MLFLKSILSINVEAKILKLKPPKNSMIKTEKFLR